MDLAEFTSNGFNSYSKGYSVKVTSDGYVFDSSRITDLNVSQECDLMCFSLPQYTLNFTVHNYDNEFDEDNAFIQCINAHEYTPLLLSFGLDDFWQDFLIFYATRDDITFSQDGMQISGRGFIETQMTDVVTLPRSILSFNLLAMAVGLKHNNVEVGISADVQGNVDTLTPPVFQQRSILLQELCNLLPACPTETIDGIKIVPFLTVCVPTEKAKTIPISSMLEYPVLQLKNNYTYPRYKMTAHQSVLKDGENVVLWSGDITVSNGHINVHDDFTQDYFNGNNITLHLGNTYYPCKRISNFEKDFKTNAEFDGVVSNAEYKDCEVIEKNAPLLVFNGDIEFNVDDKNFIDTAKGDIKLDTEHFLSDDKLVFCWDWFDESYAFDDNGKFYNKGEKIFLSKSFECYRNIDIDYDYDFASNSIKNFTLNYSGDYDRQRVRNTKRHFRIYAKEWTENISTELYPDCELSIDNELFNVDSAKTVSAMKTDIDNCRTVSFKVKCSPTIQLCDYVYVPINKNGDTKLCQITRADYTYNSGAVKGVFDAVIVDDIIQSIDIVNGSLIGSNIADKAVSPARIDENFAELLDGRVVRTWYDIDGHFCVERF